MQVWPGPPCFHLNSLWTIWNRSLNILCEPSLLSSLRHPSLELFKVFYQGACLRDSSLQAGWPTYSVLPSLFTLVSCSFSFHLPGAYLLIYRLLSHSPSIILFCAIQLLGVFSQDSPAVWSYGGRQSVLQEGDFNEQEKLWGSAQSHYSNIELWDLFFFGCSGTVQWSFSPKKGSAKHKRKPANNNSNSKLYNQLKNDAALKYECNKSDASPNVALISCLREICHSFATVNVSEM